MNKNLKKFDKTMNRIILISLLAVAVFVVYANSLPGPFLFDDELLVKSNPLITSFSNIPVFFKTDIFAHSTEGLPQSNSYRPLQTLTYAVDFFLWGDDPMGFHITNVLIHIVNTFLVLLLAQKIFKDLFLALFVSALFGLHPVNTQCVSYIAGRADLLTAAFMFISILLYVDYSETNKNRFLAASTLSYLCAVYSKEYAAFAVPALIFLYNTVFDSKNVFKTKRYAPYLLSLVLYIPARMGALSGLTPRSLELSRISLFSRVFTSLKTLFIDIRILLLPYDLHFGRTTGVERSLFGSPYAVLVTIGVVAIAFILYHLYRKWRRERSVSAAAVFFGVSWFLVSMLPLVNIVPLQVFHSDNWLYFSSVGVYMVFAAALNYLSRILPKRSALGRYIFSAFLCIILILYGTATIRRNDDYRDKIKFYLSSLRWRPNVKFYRAVGALYGEKGDYGNAVKYLEKAIEVNKLYPSEEVTAAYYNLGVTYMRLSMYKEAEDAFDSVMISDNELLKKGAGEQLLYLKNRKNKDTQDVSI